MRFELSDELLVALRAFRAQSLPLDAIERREDAFVLDPGMGPIAYLTADGRVLLDERAWFGEHVVEASDENATKYITVGARKTGIAKLLELLPDPPQDAERCDVCDGERWDPRFGGKIVCHPCAGRGWRLGDTRVP